MSKSKRKQPGLHPIRQKWDLAHEPKSNYDRRENDKAIEESLDEDKEEKDEQQSSSN